MEDCRYMPEAQNSYEAFTLNKFFKKKRPSTIHFELTTQCNLRCVHCLYPHKKNKNELTTKEIFDALLQLEKIGVFYLALSGGEIFTRKDIEEILDYLMKHRFLLTIYTNGTLLDDFLISKIARLNPLGVEISVYGATADVHDAVTTVPGSFDKTIKNIKAFCDAKVRTIFKGFLLKNNFDQHWQMIELANKIGVPYAFDYNLIPQINGNTNNLSEGLTISQIKTIYQEVAEEGLILRNHVKIKARDSQLPEGGRVICNAGLINGCIGADGNVYPCPILRKPMGNIRDNAFEKIWDTKEIDDIRYMKLEDLKTCSSCSVLEYCNRCPGVAFLETGDYLGPAPKSVCYKYKALTAKY